jgi:hypothetical protein
MVIEDNDKNMNIFLMVDIIIKIDITISALMQKS